jgi:hypothetical protein
MSSQKMLFKSYSLHSRAQKKVKRTPRRKKKTETTQISTYTINPVMSL